MRTTVDLDEDVILRLKDLSDRSDKPLKVVLNDTIRLGLLEQTKQAESSPKRFVLRTFGPEVRPKPGISFESTSKLLDLLEGEDRKW